MNILLFGPAGSGKGTQSELLVENQGMHHISTGDLFRSAIKNQTPLGVEAKGYMDQGNLVPDAIVIGMVEEELKKNAGKSFVLDGFPRTVPQAEALKGLLTASEMSIGRAIFLEVAEDVLVKRMTGRRVCKSCGAVYHIEAKPPQAEGVCDKCGGQVAQRDDDQEEAIRKRLQLYAKETSPLKEFYDEQNKLTQVDGLGTADEVFSRVSAVIAD